MMGLRRYGCSDCRLPIVGSAARSWLRSLFPELAVYGNILTGLPEPDGRAEWVYCWHVLEHLSLEDFRNALSEVLRLLKPGGVFRGVLPDLEEDVRAYLESPDENACSRFMEATCLGTRHRAHGLPGYLREFLGNSRHLWMWDFKGLSAQGNRIKQRLDW